MKTRMVREQISGAKIIGFPRGVGSKLVEFVKETGVDAVGLDWTVDRIFARDHVQSLKPVQGNVDPLALLAGPERIEAGWWDGQHVARDYFVARNGAQSLLWVYRERDVAAHWYVHGFFS